MLRSLFALLCCLCAAPAPAAERLRVVTTLPDLADWVRQIGGERVEATSLLRGFEDPHTYEPRVSDARDLARARVLVKVGLGLEEWLDGLVESAGSPELRIVEASQGVPVLEDEADQHGHRHGHGHAHALGNPHVWLSPENAALMCRTIAEALTAADPGGAETYRGNLEAYLARLEALAARLRREAQTLPDRRFLAYHSSWPYFARSLGLEQAGVVAPIPGQEPSARALAALVQRIRRDKLRVLVSEPQLSSKMPDLLAQEAGIRVVTLSTLLGPEGPESYLELLEHNAQALLRALREPSP
ncbi:MAG: metal ABC transporter substrate-binding protein [Deferrisomatales bacterium]|nr:metal ABC transporter substrate-binding protein [Deferrisomatales bacterium]